jgi:uncharacterized membrane protein
MIPRPRIETLSDMVFGLALSIGALTLVAKVPTSPADIRNGIFGFFFSFIILVSVWLRYTRIMSALPLETAWTVLLNVLLLFLVSVEPYLLSVLNSAQLFSTFDYASVAYAIDLAGLVTILGLFAHILTQEDRKLIPSRMLDQQRWVRNAFFLSALLFLVSTLPIFAVWKVEGEPARIMFWYVSLVLLWSSHLTRFRKGKE